MAAKSKTSKKTKTANRPTGRKTKSERDVEKAYPMSQFIAKLRRLADCLENGKRFTISVAGERVSVPARALVNIEHERDGDEEELEFQIKWKP